MSEDPRYEEGVELFRNGHYFEAHEVLELSWRAQPPGTWKLFLQGLIQLAVSLEHWRRQNARGARGQWEKARAKLEPLPADYGGIALGRLLERYHAFYGPRELDRWVELQRTNVLPPKETGTYPAPEWITERPSA